MPFVSVKVFGKGGNGWSIVLAEMNDAACDCTNWTQCGISGFGKADDFAAYSVFLVGKFKCNEGGRQQLCWSGGGKVQVGVACF